MVTRERQLNNRRFSGQKASRKWLFFGGDCPNVTEYLAQRTYLSYWGPIKFIDALLRGYGQVVFANNPVSGVLVLLALTIDDLRFSVAGLLTSCVGLLASLVLIPQNAVDIKQGLTVYNPLLIGLITTSALPERYNIQPQHWHWFMMLFAAIFSVYVTSAFNNILGSLTRFPLPCFTMPFNVVQPVLFLCIVSLSNSGGHSSSPLISEQLTSSVSPLQNLEFQSRMTTSTQRALNGDFTDMRLSLYPSSHIPSSAEVAINHSSLHAKSKVPDDLQGPPNFDQPVTALVHFDKNKSIIKDHTISTRIKDATKELPRYTTGANTGHQVLLNQMQPSNANDMTDSDQYYGTVPLVVSPSLLPSKSNKSMKTEMVNTGNRSFGTRQLLSWKVEDSHKVDNRYVNLFSILNRININSVGLMDSIKAGSIAHQNESISRLKRSTNSSEDEEGTVNTDWGQVFSGVVLSMSRVYGSNYPQGAILIYLAVLLCSPTLAALAFIGATIGTLTGVLLTEPITYATAGGVYEGAWGSNGLLCAMSVGGYCFVLTWQSALTAIFSAIFATALQFILIPAFASGNLYPMSLPFNLSTLLLLCAISPGALVRPDIISFPERHRSEYRRHLHTQGVAVLPTEDVDKDLDATKVPVLSV